MGLEDPASGRLAVSVVVPARNEEACLGACLQSLVEQSGISFEIIVVDDGSTDRTRQIAESFAGIRVINPPPLPLGWTGKNNAVTAGAKVASGEWLLFTDADTIHHPGFARACVGRGKAARCDFAFLFSRAGSAWLLGESSDAGDLRRTGCAIQAIGCERSGVSSSGGEWTIHSGFAGGL